jgi:drug/metabolite transporter (DMT)-like permease
MVPFFWRTPSGWLQWLLFASLGLIGGLGHYFVARAFSYGRAAMISPFHYAQLIWASLVGYVSSSGTSPESGPGWAPR